VRTWLSLDVGGRRSFRTVMERSNSCAWIGGHADAVDPAERDRRSNRPWADGPHGPPADGFIGGWRRPRSLESVCDFPKGPGR